MSVRATERLIGDVVILTPLPKSPQMVVKSVNAETKIITAVWFTSCGKYQEGTFPAGALDRVEAKPKAKPAPKAKRRPKK